ncbi:hypothetical protein A2572_04960 [Candidatus Collierbacteria bacterium RIFOXYD1_FULL_40_9]|uniref:Uncharacterized protein n=1 Tax=Candidatus Collierbacteria bacterium RIFOXYD1_FULL_40_9 TaxID=1817731 RepID=A0A1F5FV26_9BACT|nr:MAG: hypothetical protein A2572_04960 [Candidatus Collierbacteria bacterium RIFOXYD1_FULL_40_9]
MIGTTDAGADERGQNGSGFGGDESHTDIYDLIEGLLDLESGPVVVMITTDGGILEPSEAFLRMLRDEFEVIIIGTTDPNYIDFAETDSIRRMQIREGEQND